MKKRIILIIIFFIICIAMFSFICQKYDKQTLENIADANVIEQKKYDIGATGNSNIYEIQKDTFDGREVLVVKPSIKYKVAFAGMVKKSKPDISEIDTIFNSNCPQKKGVWIEEKSRENILELIKNSQLFNCTYSIDEEGYLIVSGKNKENENDIKLQKAINSNNQYILNISSVCYIVDDITGDILEYSFENMDKYQTYEYFYDKDNYIIFITENKNNQLSKNEIVNSIINLIGE